MPLPVVYEAEPHDLRTAVDNVRNRVANLRQPRLYALAVGLTVLHRRGRITEWPSWDSPPPTSAKGSIRRRDFEWAMAELFGAPRSALIRDGSQADLQLRHPPRVSIDVLFKAKATGPLTVVSLSRIPELGGKNSVKLKIDDMSWVWSVGTGDTTPPPTIVEYNPVNSLDQQNGVGCALSTADAVAESPDDPSLVYAIPRRECKKRRSVAGQEHVCAINERVCGGQGNQRERLATKPRLLAPAVDGGEDLVLPGSIDELVERATQDELPLPSAQDLSLIVSWCHTGGSGSQDAARLVSLLGAKGIQRLASTS